LSEGTPAPASNRRQKRYFRVFLVIAVLAVALGIALYTGWPQRFAVQEIVQHSLGGRVVAKDVSLLNRFRVKHFTLYDGPREQAANKPAVSIQGLNVNYNLPALVGERGRALRLVTADRIQIDLDGSNPEDTTYDFLKPLLTPSSTTTDRSGTPLRYVPQRIDIASLGAALRLPSMDLSLDSLSFRAHVQSLDNIHATLQGSNIKGAYRTVSPPLQHQFDTGSMNINLVYDDGSLRAKPLDVSLPGLADVAGEVTVQTWPFHYDIDLDKCVVQAVDLSQSTPNWVPVPLRFAKADLSGTKLHGGLNGLNLEFEEGTILGKIEKLTLGPPDAYYYSGDLEIQGKAARDAAELTLILNGGQSLAFKGSGTLIQGKAAVTWSDWSRDDLHSALPKAVAPYLDFVPNLNGLTGHVDVDWNRPQFHAKGEISAPLQTKSQDNETIHVSMDASTALDSHVSHGDLKTTLAGGTLKGTFEYDGLKSISGKAQLDHLDVARGARALGLPPFLQDFESIASGAVAFKGPPAALAITTDLLATPVPFVAYPLPKGEGLSLKAEGAIDLAGLSGAGKLLRLGLGDDGFVSLTNWQGGLSPLNLSAAMAGQMDLGSFAARFELGPLSGEAKLDGPVHLTPADLKTTPHIAVSGLAYGGLGLSYSTPLEIDCATDLHFTKKSASFAQLAAHIGDGTRINIAKPALTWFPVRFNGDIDLTSDLQPLVDMNLLGQVEGKADAQGHLDYGPEGLKMNFSAFDAAAEVAQLPKGTARFAGFRADGKGSFDGALRGEWKVGMARTETAGLVLTDVFGNATLKSNAFNLTLDKGKLYAGRLYEATVKVDFSGGTTKVSGSAQFRDVDLDVFTKEFKPPGTKLTGVVYGGVRFALSGSKVTQASFKMRAPRGFSINKDLIREQLLKQTVSDATLGLLFSQADKTSSGQRYFDSADLQLAFDPADNKLKGEAVLVSKELRLEVPMTIDIRVITEALKYQQQKRLQNLENIRLKPVEFKK